MTTTVRITERSHSLLKQLAEEEGSAMQEVVDKAVEAYRRERFLERANLAFAALRKLPTEWEAELEERKEWEATLADGLDRD